MTPQQIGCLKWWCWSLGHSIDFSPGFGNFTEESRSPCYSLASLQMYLKKMLDELQARVSVFCLQSGCLQSFMSTGENNQGSFNTLWAVLPPGASGKETWGTIWWKEAFLPSSRHVPLFLTFFLRCFPLGMWSSIQTPPLTLLSPLTESTHLLIFVSFLWFGPLKSFIWMTSGAS